MKSIKMKITVSIIICSLISSVFIGVYSISNARKVADEESEKVMELTCINKSNEINGLISKVEQSVDTLSSIALAKLDFNEFKSNDEYVEEYTNNLLEDVLSFGENTDGAITVYVRYNPDFTEPTSGIFFSRSSAEDEFESLTPTDFTMYDETDTAHVGWYYIPVENKAPLWMDPYLNENINVYMISYVVPLYVDGTSVGIIGMDIDFTQLTNIADTTQVLDTGYAFLSSSDGNLMHHKEYDVGQDIAEINSGELSDIKTCLADESKENTILDYTYNGVDKSMVFSNLDNGMILGLTALDSEMESKANVLSNQLIGFIIICILLSAILGILISASIANPIKKLTKIIEQTSKLNFKKSEYGTLLQKRNDETGIMAGAVSEMRRTLRELVTNMEMVENTILQNVDELDAIMKENNSISENNSSITQEMAAGMEETTANTTIIAANINDVKQNSAEIKDISGKGQQNSKEVMTRASKLCDTTVESSEKTMQVYETMKERTQEAILQSKAVEKINELTDDIKNISTQTNLLALNANIEAARAGEAGRGFAVVATEIGNLANQTYETVDGINDIVSEVNLAVSNMTGCIQTIMEFLEKTVVVDYQAFREVGEKYKEDANTFIETMSNVGEDVITLNTKINEIANTIEEVNGSISQSAEGVTMIAEKSSEAVTKTVDGYSHLKDCKESVELLREIIDKFQI